MSLSSKSPDPILLKRMADDFLSGMTYAEICQRYHCGTRTVSLALHENNIDGRVVGPPLKRARAEHLPQLGYMRCVRCTIIMAASGDEQHCDDVSERQGALCEVCREDVLTVIIGSLHLPMTDDESTGALFALLEM